jgi:hypothetical protein
MNNSTIIPFGKYKGQTLEAIQHDKQYLDWLQAQDWFRQRYQQLNTVIINNFQQPAETPEHNRLQAMFLKDFFLEKLLNRFIEKKICPASKEVKLNLKGFKHTVHGLKNNYLSCTPSLRPLVAPDILSGNEKFTYKPNAAKNKMEYYSDCQDKLSIPFSLRYAELTEFTTSYQKRYTVKNMGVIFEADDADVVLILPGTMGRCKFELKPSFGDDYPAILRQMSASKSNYLLAEEFTGTTVSLSEVKKMFWTKGIAILLTSDLD